MRPVIAVIRLTDRTGLAEHAPSQGQVVGEGPVWSTGFREFSNFGQRTPDTAP